MNTSCRKPVFVSIYVVKSTRKDTSNGGPRHRHHHHYVHHVHHRASGVGYDRRAQLLSYSQQLRAAARRSLASPRRSLASRGASPRRGTSPRRGASPRRGVSPVRKTNKSKVIVPLRRNASNGRRSKMGNLKKTLLPSKSFQARRKRNNAMRKLHASLGKKLDALLKSLGMKQGFMRRLLTIFGKRK